MRGYLFLALFLSIFGCKSNGSAWVSSPAIDSVNRPILKTATVNWAIAPGVIDLASPRVSVIVEEIAKMRDIDVMCFEEVWSLEAKLAIVAALGSGLHTYFVPTNGENQHDGVNVCSSSQIQDATACARKKCANLPVEEQSICAHKECRGDLAKLYLRGGFKCLVCLVTSVGDSVDEIVKNCEQKDPVVPIDGVSRAFDGQNGVLLTSRYPLKNPEVLRLQASFSNRVALFVTVEIKDYEPIEIACTHISTGNDIPPDNPNFSDWDEEMNAQIDAISRRLKERAENRPSIFLGDMNAGPALGGWISESSPNVWNRIVELGFRSPAAQANPPFCSICKDNTLRDVKVSGNKLEISYVDKSYLIDHVLTRDPIGGTELETVSASQVANQRRVFKGYDGAAVERHLSDHYGVVVEFRLRNK